MQAEIAIAAAAQNAVITFPRDLITYVLVLENVQATCSMHCLPD
jgi:hypothetical protein